METYSPVNLAYDVFESPKGSNSSLAPVIFLHGYASDRKTWTDIPSIIAEKTDRKTYIFDARNYGDSEYTEEFSQSLNVEDFFHFMNVINVQKAILVAHSLGAYTALNATLKKPEKVEMVISEDTYLEPFTEKLITEAGDYIKSLADIIEKIPNNLDESEVNKFVADEMYEALSEENKKWAPKDTSGNLRVPFKRDPDGNYVANYNERALFESSREFQRWQTEPVGLYEGQAIFLYGNKSPLNMMNQVSHIRKFFPNAEFVELDGGYHSLHSLLKNEFIEAILKFINKSC